MITIHYDFTNGTEVSYLEGLKLEDDFTTCCTNFFSFNNDKDVIVIKKNGDYIIKNDLLKFNNGYILKEMRITHNIENMLNTGSFTWKNE